MDQVEEIKQRLDIVDLISSYLELKKAGANYKAICPFHNEKTPSFMVSSDKGIFKCFGCQESGDIFSFVQKMEGVDFPEALKILAEKAGVRLQRIDKKFYDQKRTLYEIYDVVTSVYNYLLLKDKAGKPALDYLIKRGITKKTINEFNIGYAPQNFEFISNFLLKKGYREQDIIGSGLSLLRERKRENSLPIFDRFRGRIMFPIYNPAGNVIAFSGRILKDNVDAPKYINSPDSPLYSKSRNLFALDKAKTEIRKNGFVVLVEGTMDVILSHQAGFNNTVAPLGTALTEEQVKSLSRLTSKFIFAFDADEAGVTATKRGVEMALGRGIDVAVASIPIGFKDTAEVITKDPVLWRESLLKSRPYIDYVLEQALKDKKENLSPSQKRDIAIKVLPEIAKISDPIIAGDYINHLAARLETQERYLYEALEKIQETRSKKQEIKTKKGPSYSESRENHLLGLLIAFPQYLDSVRDFLAPSDFNSKTNAAIYNKLKKEYAMKRKFNIKKFTQNLGASERDLVSNIVLDVENEYSQEDNDIAAEEILSLVERIKQQRKEETCHGFEEKLRQAEKSQDKEKIKKLIREFQELVIGNK